MKKEPDLSDLSPKKIQKVLMKIDKMADVFLNSADFRQHASFYLAPLRSYTMKLQGHPGQSVIK